MTNETYRRIRFSVVPEYEIDKYGKAVFSNKMRSRIYDLEEKEREKIILKCNESVLGKWHAHFYETPFNIFSVDLYIESEKDFIIASNIIKENIDNKSFDYIFRKTFPPSL